VTISPTTSWIDPDVCIGCKACIGLCPYSAIEFDELRQVSVINEAMCKGCGSCAGHCPSGAAQVRHFNQRQVFAELDGLLKIVPRVKQEEEDMTPPPAETVEAAPAETEAEVTA
jgi:heterodisulfide reductase subunit A